jgi:pilus assembly protein Flp/PilA
MDIFQASMAVPSARQGGSAPNLRRTPMKNFKQILSNLLKEESGQDLIEYALVAALIALGATAAMTSLSGIISSTFTSIGTRLTAAV